VASRRIARRCERKNTFGGTASAISGKREVRTIAPTTSDHALWQFRIRLLEKFMLESFQRQQPAVL